MQSLKRVSINKFLTSADLLKSASHNFAVSEFIFNGTSPPVQKNTIVFNLKWQVNGPFPGSLVRLFQRESKCETRDLFAIFALSGEMGRVGRRKACWGAFKGRVSRWRQRRRKVTRQENI